MDFIAETEPSLNLPTKTAVIPLGGVAAPSSATSQSRIDRLFVILETGQSNHLRQTAANQLAEIVGMCPDTLPPMTQRLLSLLLRQSTNNPTGNPSAWEVRETCSIALSNLVPHWLHRKSTDVNHSIQTSLSNVEILSTPLKSYPPDEEKYSTSTRYINDSSTKNISNLSHSNNLGLKSDRSSIERNWSNFLASELEEYITSFDVLSISKHGDKLLSSAGTEFDEEEGLPLEVKRKRLETARVEIQKETGGNLGPGIPGTNSLPLDWLAEDDVSSSSNKLSMNGKSLPLVSKEPDASQPKKKPLISSKKIKKFQTQSSSPNLIVIPTPEDLVHVIGILIRQGLLNEIWSTRHGSVLGLDAIMDALKGYFFQYDIHGHLPVDHVHDSIFLETMITSEKKLFKSSTSDQDKVPSQALLMIDTNLYQAVILIAFKCLHLLATESFADFVGERTVAPVREAAASLMHTILSFISSLIKVDAFQQIHNKIQPNFRLESDFVTETCSGIIMDYTSTIEEQPGPDSKQHPKGQVSCEIRNQKFIRPPWLSGRLSPKSIGKFIIDSLMLLSSPEGGLPWHSRHAALLVTKALCTSKVSSVLFDDFICKKISVILTNAIAEGEDEDIRLVSAETLLFIITNCDIPESDIVHVSHASIQSTLVEDVLRNENVMIQDQNLLKNENIGTAIRRVLPHHRLRTLLCQQLASAPVDDLSPVVAVNMQLLAALLEIDSGINLSPEITSEDTLRSTVKQEENPTKEFIFKSISPTESTSSRTSSMIYASAIKKDVSSSQNLIIMLLTRLLAYSRHPIRGVRSAVLRTIEALCMTQRRPLFSDNSLDSITKSSEFIPGNTTKLPNAEVNVRTNFADVKLDIPMELARTILKALFQSMLLEDEYDLLEDTFILWTTLANVMHGDVIDCEVGGSFLLELRSLLYQHPMTPYSRDAFPWSVSSDLGFTISDICTLSSVLGSDSIRSSMHYKLDSTKSVAHSKMNSKQSTGIFPGTSTGGIPFQSKSFVMARPTNVLPRILNKYLCARALGYLVGYNYQKQDSHIILDEIFSISLIHHKTTSFPYSLPCTPWQAMISAWVISAIFSVSSTGPYHSPSSNSSHLSFFSEMIQRSEPSQGMMQRLWFNSLLPLSQDTLFFLDEESEIISAIQRHLSMFMNCPLTEVQKIGNIPSLLSTVRECITLQNKEHQQKVHESGSFLSEGMSSTIQTNEHSRIAALDALALSLQNIHEHRRLQVWAVLASLFIQLLPISLDISTESSMDCGIVPVETSHIQVSSNNISGAVPDVMNVIHTPPRFALNPVLRPLVSWLKSEESTIGTLTTMISSAVLRQPAADSLVRLLIFLVLGTEEVVQFYFSISQPLNAASKALANMLHGLGSEEFYQEVSPSSVDTESPGELASSEVEFSMIEKLPLPMIRAFLFIRSLISSCLNYSRSILAREVSGQWDSISQYNSSRSTQPSSNTSSVNYLSAINWIKWVQESLFPSKMPLLRRLQLAWLCMASSPENISFHTESTALFIGPIHMITLCSDLPIFSGHWEDIDVNVCGGSGSDIPPTLSLPSNLTIKDQPNNNIDVQQSSTDMPLNRKLISLWSGHLLAIAVGDGLIYSPFLDQLPGRSYFSWLNVIDYHPYPETSQKNSDKDIDPTPQMINHTLLQALIRPGSKLCLLETNLIFSSQFNVVHDILYRHRQEAVLDAIIAIFCSNDNPDDSNALSPSVIGDRQVFTLSRVRATYQSFRKLNFNSPPRRIIPLSSSNSFDKSAQSPELIANKSHGTMQEIISYLPLLAPPLMYLLSMPIAKIRKKAAKCFSVVMQGISLQQSTNTRSISMSKMATSLECNKNPTKANELPFNNDPLLLSLRQSALEFCDQLFRPSTIPHYEPDLKYGPEEKEDFHLKSSSNLTLSMDDIINSCINEKMPDVNKESMEPSFSSISHTTLSASPSTLPFTLRPYQKEGISWLAFLARYGLHGILCDDMGLGKTIQMLTILAAGSLYGSLDLSTPSKLESIIELKRYSTEDVSNESGNFCTSSRDFSECTNASIHKDVLVDISPAKTQKMPSLIIAPPSLLQHWKGECERLTGTYLRPLLYHGPDRRSLLLSEILSWGQEEYSLSSSTKSIDSHMNENHQHQTTGLRDISDSQWNKEKGLLVITSYDVARLDADLLSSRPWAWVVLDEGHAIRNSASKTTIAIKRLIAMHRVILSGTPLQNSPVELWSLFDFLMPGYLGDTLSQFMKRYGKAIVQAASSESRSMSKTQRKEIIRQSAEALERLHRVTNPFMLRRMKEDVLADLPPKIITDVIVDLSPSLRWMYETILRRDTEQNVHVFATIRKLLRMCSCPALLDFGSSVDSISSSGTSNAEGMIPDSTDILLNMKESIGMNLTTKKQAIDLSSNTIDFSMHHPQIADLHSPKIAALGELLSSCGINEEAQRRYAHRAIIIFQSTTVLEWVERHFLVLSLPNVAYLKLDGTIPAARRGDIVQSFNENFSIAYLLMTIGVGGEGLNLTGADVVIFYECDWNPTKDLQAMDRAHRLGQKKSVSVYRLLTRGTLEERLMSLQRFKLHMASSIITQQNASLSKMDTTNLVQMLSFSSN